MPLQVTTVTPHLRCLFNPADTPQRHGAANSYLIGDASEAILVDAGFAGEDEVAEAMRALAAAGAPRIALLVLTHHHIDHTAGAAALATRLGCPVAAHPQAIPRLPRALQAVRPLQEGDRLTAAGLTLTALDAPGHVDGHLHLHLPADRAMLVADNLAGAGTVAILPPEGNLNDYLATLRRLLTYDLDVLAPGHGPPITAPRPWIEGVIAHRLQREAQVLACLEQAPLTVSQLTEHIYGDTIASPVVPLAELTLLAHLLKLQAEGRAEPAGERWSLTS